MHRPSSHRGFTLIEMLVTVVILSVLAAIAIPSFIESIRKGRRSDAIALLTGAQQAQERYRANRAAYAGAWSDFQDANLPMPATTGAHYSIAITQAGITTYSITATALTSSPQNDDTRCAVMTAAMIAGGELQYSSGTGASQLVGANSPCWAR